MKRALAFPALLAVLTLAGLLPSTLAQVPARISFQGLVLDHDQTLPDATYRVTFRLYDQQNGGQPLWRETQAVTLQDGMLSTLVGAQQDLNLPFDRPYFLSIELEGEPESQRMALSAAPYALLARNVPDSTVVRSISGLKDTVELVAGDGIAIQQRDNQLIISANTQAPLKHYGPPETALQASVKTTGARPLTEAEDEAAIEALLKTLGPGGSNTGLDAAYDEARVVTLDNGAIVLLGSGSGNGFVVRDSDLLIRDDSGGDPEFRFRVDDPEQVWLLSVDAATSSFAFANKTDDTTPLRVNKGATDRLLTLENSALELRDASGTTTITLDADYQGSGDGRVITAELEITGGSDLSERFDVSAGFGLKAPEPGMVVSIDPARPGGLTVSGRPYDPMVAGIVSGAGGIETGVLMGQRGSEADGSMAVALTGRVYVWVDASYGAVSPGDLLTSSSTPGHAMKVGDYGRSQGAIVGKAMTGLASGRGLVLVLVSLQ